MNEHDFFKSYRRFTNDYERLERWYLATLLSYDYSIDEMSRMIDQKRREGRGREKVYFKEEQYGKTYLIQHDHHDLLKKYGKGYKSFLEEMILIRLVSLLEVLLSEMIESCFYYNKRLFFTKGKYEINVSEFLYKDKQELEEEYIKKLVDKHSRGGLVELKKFYNKNLDIDLTSFYKTDQDTTFSYKEIERLHDTRHLIIHQLGRTDQKYRTKYNYAKKAIQLTAEEIFYYIELVESFAEFLKNELQRKIIVPTQ